MTPALFVLDDIPDDDQIYLVGDEGHHAARVRRVAVGEAVLLSDGAGTLLRCTVRSLTRDGVHLRVASREHVAEPVPRIVAVQALPKGERAELAVEVLTELGVDEIVPWAAARSVTQWVGVRGEKALERWRRTAREAGKQSRRARFPAVAELASTAQVVALLRDATGLVLHESAQDRLGSVELPDRGDLMVIIGPEGGVTAEELAAFAQVGACAVRLGEPVLRTSTAGAAALAALSLRLGRWG